MGNIGLADAIRNLRSELMQAITEGEGEPIRFETGPIELELQVALMASAGGSVNFKWVVVSVGGEAKGQLTSTHKVKLSLTPVNAGNPAERIRISQSGSKPE